jgi:hypothetical protein
MSRAVKVHGLENEFADRIGRLARAHPALQKKRAQLLDVVLHAELDNVWRESVGHFGVRSQWFDRDAIRPSPASGFCGSQLGARMRCMADQPTLTDATEGN